MKYTLLSFVLIISLFSCKKSKDDVPVLGLKLSQSTVVIKLGDTTTLTVAFTPDNASDKSLTWISRKDSIVTVDQNGKLAAKAFGKTYVVVTGQAGTIQDSCVVTVSDTASSTTITLGAGYANDVFYSFEKGVVAVVPRTNWDIAFNTYIRSSTIITNGAAGINLYTYPKGDTSAWKTLDTSGMKLNIDKKWNVLYNSDTTWSFGAFERNTAGTFDYGWAKYNTISHDLLADSLYVIQLQDKSFKKLWMKRKYSSKNIYAFIFANIDGTNEVTTTVDCSLYTGKNFIYYTFANNQVVDREPAKDTWDVVVGKYYEMVALSPGGVKVPYIVTGVLTNSGVLSATIDNADVTTIDYSAAKFVTNMSEIGSDWKTFDQNTNKYVLVDKRVYFVQNKNSNIYKLLFTSFVGSSTGVLTFEQTKLK